MEERTTEFQVGDKVICGIKVGTITKITPKRKDITVDFEGYTETFGSDGWTRGDIWNMRHIEKWTPEGQREIDEVLVIKTCKKLFEKVSGNKMLTPDMAKKIINILEGEIRE